MMTKRIGRYEVRTYTDGDTATIIYHCNESVTKQIPIHSEDGLRDLEYALEIIRREIVR